MEGQQNQICTKLETYSVLSFRNFFRLCFIITENMNGAKYAYETRTPLFQTP